MRFIVYLLPVLAGWLTSCQPASTDPLNPLVTECVGSSTYLIDNQSEYDLAITLTFSPERGSKVDSAQTVARNQQKQIAQDGLFGAIPKPTNTFSRLTLYRVVGGRLVVAYEQTPISNPRWRTTKQHPADPDFGCYAVTNTLTITDADLR